MAVPLAQIDPPLPGAAQPAAASPARCSWEEFRLYFETTEKVIDRRHALNSWNYGICLATLTASGLLANWAAAASGLRLIVLAGVAVLAGMGFLLCLFWVGQIRDAKLLNNAKFAVLQEMAPLLIFPDGARSYEPLVREWAMLSNQGATEARAGLRIRVLKSSSAEFLLPRAFMAVFGLIIAVVAVLCMFNSAVLTKGAFAFPASNAQVLAK